MDGTPGVTGVHAASHTAPAVRLPLAKVVAVTEFGGVAVHAEHCPDVDGVISRAVAAGATVREPATNCFASIRYPFGVRWSVLTRAEDIPDEESAARVADWAAQQG
ncbi:hypothetical protein B5P43_19645 [Bacillus sp. SRB_336]|nr:hypothetical protein B5P43_19645 [Bacillus sp. SRB_336]